MDDERPPFSYVQIEGIAILTDDMVESRRGATQIAGRYMGADLADAYGKCSAVAGELLVRIVPTRIHGEKNISA